MATVNGNDSNSEPAAVPPSSLIRRVSSRSIRNSISEERENGECEQKSSFVSKYKKTPEALKTFHMADAESELEVPGTPMTPRTSTTPGLLLIYLIYHNIKCLFIPIFIA